MIHYLTKIPGLPQPWVYVMMVLGLGCSGKLGDSEPYKASETVSPNGHYALHLIELERYPDRNFQLRLVDYMAKTTNLIFTSPDEGDKGTEKIYWSSNSDYFLLTGKTFYLDPQVSGATNNSGEQLYLMYQLSSHKLWCNAAQTRTPRFGEKDIEEIGFMFK